MRPLCRPGADPSGAPGVRACALKRSALEMRRVAAEWIGAPPVREDWELQPVTRMRAWNIATVTITLVATRPDRAR